MRVSCKPSLNGKPQLLMEKKPLIYIASPYTHEDKDVEKERFETIRALTAKIISYQDKIVPFSPIVYTHDLNQYCKDVTSQDWYELDLIILARCDGMIVVMLDGWEESTGVALEIKHAKEMCIPITYSHKDTIMKACQWVRGIPVL